MWGGGGRGGRKRVPCGAHDELPNGPRPGLPSAPFRRPLSISRRARRCALPCAGSPVLAAARARERRAGARARAFEARCPRREGRSGGSAEFVGASWSEMISAALGSPRGHLEGNHTAVAEGAQMPCRVRGRSCMVQSHALAGFVGFAKLSTSIARPPHDYIVDRGRRSMQAHRRTE